MTTQEITVTLAEIKTLYEPLLPLFAPYPDLAKDSENIVKGHTDLTSAWKFAVKTRARLNIASGLLDLTDGTR